MIISQKLCSFVSESISGKAITLPDEKKTETKRTPNLIKVNTYP